MREKKNQKKMKGTENKSQDDRFKLKVLPKEWAPNIMMHIGKI